MTLEIIAEVSGCHGGDLGNAIKLIDHAKVAGATGVKFQRFDIAKLSQRRAKHPRLRHLYSEGQLFALYTTTRTPDDWFPDLIEQARRRDLPWHASVFDPDDVAFLETLDCPRYKIASFEAGDDDIAAAILKTGKPHILSVNQNDDPPPFAFREAAILLHATDYGVPAKDAGLSRLQHYASEGLMRGSAKWGLSDHTIGPEASVIATALGASMIEWHIKLWNVPTPDDEWSHTENSFRDSVAQVRAIERALNAR